MKLSHTNLKTAKAILKDLEENYPNKIPLETNIPIEQIRRLQGQQDIIQHIRNLVIDEDSED